jgi:DNA-binding GntR family transcriptional regulator
MRRDDGDDGRIDYLGMTGLPRSHGSAAIVAAVVEAVSDRRLPAGTKLGEEELARLFETSRTTIRQALQHLGFLGLVRLEPKRGAYIAQPSPSYAADLYAARRAIEAETVAEATRYCTARDIRRLRQHIEVQQNAASAGDRRELVRLRGEFHLVLAEVSGNEVLTGLLAQLLPRCALIRALYDPEPLIARPIDEHVELVDLMAKGDVEAAVALVRQHLEINERRLQLAEAGAEPASLEHSLAPYLAKVA